jgi:hypothetical protein
MALSGPACGWLDMPRAAHTLDNQTRRADHSHAALAGSPFACTRRAAGARSGSPTRKDALHVRIYRTGNRDCSARRGHEGTCRLASRLPSSPRQGHHLLGHVSRCTRGSPREPGAALTRPSGANRHSLLQCERESGRARWPRQHAGAVGEISVTRWPERRRPGELDRRVSRADA